MAAYAALCQSHQSMLLSPAHQERCYTIAARPEPWLFVGLFIVLLVWRTTESPIFAGVSGIFVVVLWCLGRHMISFRNDLTAARRDFAAVEEALRQSQKMEAIGRLAAGIAHDFNNHLTVISSNVELIKRRLDPDQARLIRHADAAMQGVQRAAILTGRLLSFSRQPGPEPEAVDVGRLLTGLFDLLCRTLGEGVDLRVRPPNEQSFVWSDVNQMENALLSLVVSARDRVPPGCALALAVSHVRLGDGFAATYPGVLPGEYVRISVSTSPAAADTTADVMGNWRPADDPAHPGLSMARGFVRDVGGCLLRSGSPPNGLSLCLLLPRYRPPRPAGAAVPRNRGNGQSTILVVEDDAAVRSACTEMLRELGYEVLEAPDAMEAFRLIADHGGIDLLFTDLGLPGGVSGRTLADAARNVDPDMRVLFISGYAPENDHGRSDAVLLAKPFSPAQLAEKVRQVLSARIVIGGPQPVQD